MSYLYQRLNALSPLTEIEITYRMPLILADGVEETDDGLAAADLGVMKTFFTASLDSRVTALESGGGTPSNWAAARTISLAGPFTGSVSLDGSADVTLTVTVPAGALGTSAINGLGTSLLSINNTLDDHETRLTAAEEQLGSGDSATADKWTTPRTLTLSGKAAGSVSIDGSADVELNVTGLTVNKTDVGLSNVDNTSDILKPVSTATQAALDAKAPLTGVGASGSWNITSAKATALETPRNFSLIGIVGAANVLFDGSGNLQLTTTMANGALSIAKTAGLQLALDSKLDTDATAAAAQKFATARAFTMTGVVTTSVGVNFDGTAGVNLVTSMADGALSIAKTTGLQQALNLKANADDAVLTGTPTAPTPITTTVNTQIPTCAYVVARIANDAPSKTGVGASGTWNISVGGNAATASNATSAAAATKLATARTFSLSGVVTAAAVNFDGTAPVVLSTVIADGALAISKTSGLQGILDGKLNESEVDANENGNTVVRRNALGDVRARLLRTSFGDQSTMSGAIAYRINNTTDDYTRYCNSPSAIRTWLGMDTSDAVQFSRVAAGYDAGMANSFSCSNWFRSSGNTGWYNSDYAGGWHMTDATYVRSFNAKAVTAGDFVITSDATRKAGVREFEWRGRLRPVNYLHKDSFKADVGFIAQEVQALYPELVGRFSDSGLLNLSYPKITAVLSAQLNRLEDRYEAKIVELELQLRQLQRPWWKRLLRRA